VSEPEPEKGGKYLAPALLAPQDDSSGVNAGSLCLAMVGLLLLCPAECIKTFQTPRDLKQGCHYLNLTF